jgi:NAD(P)-dependent dehydrogenase (short-subunit alcohol dehydrogenase family)
MIPLPCDLTVEADVRKLFDRVEQNFGRLDVLSTLRELPR